MVIMVGMRAVVVVSLVKMVGDGDGGDAGGGGSVVGDGDSGDAGGGGSVIGENGW